MSLGGYQQEGKMQHRIVLRSQNGNGCRNGIGIPLPISHTQSTESNIYQDPLASLSLCKLPGL